MEKRPRTSTDLADTHEKASRISSDSESDTIVHWCREGNWPRSYFEQGKQTWFEELEVERLAGKRQQQENRFKQQGVRMENPTQAILIRKKSSASLRRQISELGSSSSADLLREEKSAKYLLPEYAEELKNKGNSYMYEHSSKITDENKQLCRSLLDSPQTTVQDSIFSDDRFCEACEKLQDRNEAKVVQDIGRLIVPSAENLATCGTADLRNLTECVNEGWKKIIPITDSRPQPDYSVGFRDTAFTGEQIKKLKVLVGGFADLSRFTATWRMYFPFLTCEVKCGASALDIADRQNAHSMTCAVKAVVELYRYVKWDDDFDWRKELNREILGFSISHDDKIVRIYGHYPVFEDDYVAFYRHTIHSFNFQALEGREKWSAYKFTKNVYENWMPVHLKRITKAIDALPVGLNFGVSPASSSFNIAAYPNTSIESDSQGVAETAASSQDTDRSKRPRLRPTVMLQQENDWLKQQLAQVREENKKRHEELMQQLAQEKEERKELMKQLAQEKEERKELMKQLAQEKEERKELMNLFREQRRK